MAQVPTLTFTTDSSPFGVRSPKADGINAVKLTADNVKDVAAYLIKTLGGSVEIQDDCLSVDPHKGPARYLSFGCWIVEEYDYSYDRVVVRQAKASEREKYDLR